MPWDRRDPREWANPPSWGKSDRPPPEPDTVPINPEAFLAGLGAAALTTWIFGYETGAKSLALLLALVAYMHWRHNKKARS